MVTCCFCNLKEDLSTELFKLTTFSKSFFPRNRSQIEHIEVYNDSIFITFSFYTKSVKNDNGIEEDLEKQFQFLKDMMINGVEVSDIDEELFQFIIDEKIPILKEEQEKMDYLALNSEEESEAQEANEKFLEISNVINKIFELGKKKGGKSEHIFYQKR